MANEETFMVKITVSVTFAEHTNHPIIYDLYIDERDADDDDYIELEARDTAFADLHAESLGLGDVEVWFDNLRPQTSEIYETGFEEDDEESLAEESALDFAYYDLHITELDREY